jgi:tetrahydromethanopterin S-methyltransferase subunit F
MSTAPRYELELRAAEQRKRLHSSVEELKQRVQEKLDVKRNVRRHLGLAAGAVSALGLALGYGVAGIFTRH